MAINKLNRATLALLLALGAGLGAGSVQAQVVLDVGGAFTIGDTTLTTTNVPAKGVNWTADGGVGVKYSSLTSPTITVPVTHAAGQMVTLKFTHRYNFESGWDGGAVYASVNGAAATYLSAAAFSTNGYDSAPVWTNGSSVFTGGEEVFTGLSTDYWLTTLIESVAVLGPLDPGNTVSVTFRGGWDEGFTEVAPNWEIGTFELSDSTSAVFSSINFTNDGTAGFTVTSDAGLAGPWKYLQPINRFEIDTNSLTADRYAPVSPGAVINLNGADLLVEELFFGSFISVPSNTTFALFDLSSGSSLAGNYGSISLPIEGLWDTSNLAPGGDGTIKFLGLAPPTYIGPNTTGNANTWNDPFNWTTMAVPSGGTDVVIPDGKYVVANDDTTPAYTGDLSIGAGATLQIGWTTAHLPAYNALGTPGTTTISMGAGSLISTRTGGSPIIPAITLLGDARIRLGESTQVPANADFNYPVTGAYTFTIECNQQTPTIDLNTSNSFSALVINTLGTRGPQAGTFNANVAGCLGNGAITINPNGLLTHKLAFKAVSASTTNNTLNLNGEGPAGTGAGRVRMDADNTVGFLNIYGFPYPAGTYGRVGTPATVSNQVSWIEGDSVLTVNGAPADNTPPTVAFANNFPGGSSFLGQQITYTLTFNEAVQASTVGTDDFENAGSAPVTIDSVTPDVTLAVYTVKVTPSNTGTVTLRIKSGAVITDLFGNDLVVPVSDTATITVNPLTLKGELGVWKQFANGGINPATDVAWAAGDTYRLAFVTTTKTNATSTDIADYNSFVQGVAASSTAFTNLGTKTWKVIGSTATVSAKQNTGTDPVVDGAGVAVLLMDGATVFANNNTDLWNGSPLRSSGLYMSPYFDQEGVEVTVDDSVFTGSTQAGVQSTDGRVLGGSTEVPPKVTTGKVRPNNQNRWMIQFNATTNSVLRFFALSEPMTVSAIGGGPGAVLLDSSVSGNTLTLSWPADQGWRLEAQTNTLSTGLGSTWSEIAGSASSNAVITIDPNQPTVFYRLVWP